MLKQNKILIVEDHEILAEELKHWLKTIENCEIVGIAYSIEEALKMIPIVQPTLITIDYLLPDGYGTDLSKMIKEKYPEIMSLLLTGVQNEQLNIDMIDNGLRAIISKNADGDSIVDFVTCVLKGYVLSPYDIYSNFKRKEIELVLTEDEDKLIKLVIEGKTISQIADIFYLSKRSVDNYLNKVYLKLGAENRIQAIEKYLNF